jgi:hypothetical protein
LATITLKRHRLHRYAKQREATAQEAEEFPTMEVVKPGATQRIDLSQGGTIPAGNSIMRESDTVVIVHEPNSTVRLVTIQQHTVAYASEDGRYHLSIEMGKTEAESAPDTLEITVP